LWVQAGQQAAVVAVLQCGAKAEHMTTRGDTALIFASRTPGLVEGVLSLLSFGAKVDFETRSV
jgi:hypothetical protein